MTVLLLSVANVALLVFMWLQDMRHRHEMRLKDSALTSARNEKQAEAWKASCFDRNATYWKGVAGTLQARLEGKHVTSQRDELLDKLVHQVRLSASPVGYSPACDNDKPRGGV